MQQTAASSSEQRELDEAERTMLWRKQRLEGAGYPYPLALELAIAPHVDLHRACDLVRRCPPHLAARILL